MARPGAFLRLAASGAFRLSVSAAILEEVDEILRQKFHWPEDRLAEAQELLASIAQRVVPTVILEVVKEDEDDNRILECAQTAGSEYVVTGDKDLLRLGRYDSARIVTVADFLREYRERTDENPLPSR